MENKDDYRIDFKITEKSAWKPDVINRSGVEHNNWMQNDEHVDYSNQKAGVDDGLERVSKIMLTYLVANQQADYGFEHVGDVPHNEISAVIVEQGND